MQRVGQLQRIVGVRRFVQPDLLSQYLRLATARKKGARIAKGW